MSLPHIQRQSQMIAAAEIQILLLSRNIDRQVLLQNIERDGNLATEGRMNLFTLPRRGKMQLITSTIPNLT